MITLSIQRGNFDNGKCKKGNMCFDRTDLSITITMVRQNIPVPSPIRNLLITYQLLWHVFMTSVTVDSM